METNKKYMMDWIKFEDEEVETLMLSLITTLEVMKTTGWPDNEVIKYEQLLKKLEK